MRNLLIVILFLIFSENLIAQPPVVNRGTSSTIPFDQNLFIGKSFKLPTYADTAAANTYISANVILDSCGAKIFTYNGGGNQEWTRFCTSNGTKKWVKIANQLDIDSVKLKQPQIGTISYLRSLNAQTDVMYQSTDGIFQDIGVNNAIADDGAIYVRAANNHVYKRIFSGPIDPRWFGAVNDGIIDCTLKLQSMLSYLSSAGGGNVLFSDGTYLVSVTSGSPNALTIPSNVTIAFSKYATLKLAANNLDNYSVMYLYNDTKNVTITGLNIIGDALTHTGTTGEGGMGIKMYNAHNITIRDCNIRLMWGDGIYIGGATGPSTNILIDNPNIDSSGRNGISPVWSDGLVINNPTVTHSYRTLPKAGIDIEPNAGTWAINTVINGGNLKYNVGIGLSNSGSHTTVDGLTSMYNSTGIYTSFTAASVPFDCNYNNCRLDSNSAGFGTKLCGGVTMTGGSASYNSSYGVILEQASTDTAHKMIRISGVTISNNGSRSIYTLEDDKSKIFPTIIEQCTITGNALGMYFNNDNVNFVGNHVHDNMNGASASEAGVNIAGNNCQITGNYIYNEQHDGLRISRKAANITGNHIYSNSQASNLSYSNIVLAAGSDSSSIQNNFIDKGTGTAQTNFGIVVQSGINGAIVVGNSRNGGANKNISDGGTNTIRTFVSAGVGISAVSTDTTIFHNNLSIGIAGGQSMYFGNGSGDNGVISSSTHTTKGKVYFGITGNSTRAVFDESTGNWGFGVGTNVPLSLVSIGGNVTPINKQQFGVFYNQTDSTGIVAAQVIQNIIKSGSVNTSNLNGYGLYLSNEVRNNLSYAQPLYGIISGFVSTGTGTVTNASALVAKTPQISGGGTVTTSTGLTIQAQSTTGVTNGVGVNQLGTSDLNIFNGRTGIGNSPNASAILDVASTTKGVLISRMTTTQRDAISSPADGLQIFNTDQARLNIYSTTLSAWRATMLDGLTTKTYAATTNIDFNAARMQTVSLTGDITLTTSNIRSGSEVELRVISDASSRNFTFPAGWTFMTNAAPASIAASKTGLLILRSFGTADANIIASWVVQP